MSTTSTELFDDRPVGDHIVLEVIIAYRKNKALDFPEAPELSNREFQEVSQHMMDLQFPISPPRQRTSTIRDGEVRFYWETKVGSSLHRTLYDRLDKRSKNVLWRRPKEKAAMLSNRIQFIKFNRLENLDQLTLADSYEQRERSQPHPLPRRLSMVSRIEQSQSLLARIMHSSGSPPSHHQDAFRSSQNFRTTPLVSHDPFPRYNYQEDVSRTPNSYEPQTPPPPSSRPTSPRYRQHAVPNSESSRPPSFDADHDDVDTGHSQFDKDIQTRFLNGHPADDNSSLLSRIEPGAHSHPAISKDGYRENSPYSSENMDKEIIVIEDSDDDLVEEVQEEADPEEAESQTTCSPMPVHTYRNLYASKAGRPVNDISDVYDEVEPEKNVEDLEELQGPEMEEHHDVQDNGEFSELHDEQLKKRKRVLEDVVSQQYTHVSGSEDDIHLQDIETQPRTSWPWPSSHPQRSSLETSTTVPRPRTTEASKRRRLSHSQYAHPDSNSDIDSNYDGGTTSFTSTVDDTVDDLRHQLQQEKLATLDARRRWSTSEDLKSKAERELREARDEQEALKKRVEILEKEKKVAEAERNIAEAILKDVQKECKDPFVVPALLEAFVTVSGLAMDSQIQVGDGDSGSNRIGGAEDSSGGKIWQRILQRLQVGVDRGHDLEGSGNE